MTQSSNRQKGRTTTLSELKAAPRKTLLYFLPTEAYLRGANPHPDGSAAGKAAILKWYQKRSQLLEARRKGPVKTKFSAFTQEVDAETKKPVGQKKGPVDYSMEQGRLSDQDYAVYKRGLEAQYQQLKEDHNKAVGAKKKAAEEASTV